MNESIGIIETNGYAGIVEAADAMAKAANVTVSKELTIGGGYMSVVIKGDVGSVKAAIEAGAEAVQRVGKLVAAHVIARPHPDLVKQFDL